MKSITMRNRADIFLSEEIMKGTLLRVKKIKTFFEIIKKERLVYPNVILSHGQFAGRKKCIVAAWPKHSETIRIEFLTDRKKSLLFNEWKKNILNGRYSTAELWGDIIIDACGTQIDHLKKEL